MTVQATARRVPFTGNGANTSFPFTFKCYGKTHLTVTKTVSGVDTLLVLDADYTVTLNSNQEVSPGGTITCPKSGSPLANGVLLTVLGAAPVSQGTALTNAGAFFADTIEDMDDYATITEQEAREMLSRIPKIPATDNLNATDIPSKANRAGKFRAWDANGQEVASAGSGGGDTSLRSDLASASGPGADLIAFKRTPAEILVGVVPVNPTIPSHDIVGYCIIERYGGADDNSTINNTPLSDALKVADQFDGVVVCGSGISKFNAAVVIGGAGYGRRVVGLGHSRWSFSGVGAVELVTLGANLNDLSRDQPQFENIQIDCNGVGRDGVMLTVGNYPIIRNIRINNPVRDGYVESVTGTDWIEKGEAKGILVRSAGRNAFRFELLGTAGQNPYINERRYDLEARGVSVITAGGTGIRITGSAGLGAAAKFSDNVFERSVLDAIYNTAAPVPQTSPVASDTVYVENPVFEIVAWENTGTGGNPGAGPAVKVSSGSWGSINIQATNWNSFWGDGTIDPAITSVFLNDYSGHKTILRGPVAVNTTPNTAGHTVTGNTTANTQPDYVASRTGAAVNAVGQGASYQLLNATNTTSVVVQEYNGELVVYSYPSGGPWAERVRILPAGGVRIFGFSALYSGTGAPGAGLGANGDYYLRQDTPGTANQRLYVKSAGAWVGIL